jgi:hypothetical protein
MHRGGRVREQKGKAFRGNVSGSTVPRGANGCRDRTAEASVAEPLLEAWKTGKKSQGELRRALQREIWPSYGTGLWNEPWAEFYANLAQAVQPYAHYTQQLQGWQFETLSVEHDGSTIEKTGLETY